jgi:hypothetical protein
MLIRTCLAALCGLVVFASSASAFEGRYATRGAQGFRQTAAITRKDGVYKVLLAVKSRLCTGELEAYGEEKGGKLIAAVVAQDDECKVTIARHGSGIAVSEHKCLNWHGAACDFNGQLNRQ